MKNYYDYLTPKEQKRLDEAVSRMQEISKEKEKLSRLLTRYKNKFFTLIELAEQRSLVNGTGAKAKDAKRPPAARWQAF